MERGYYLWYAKDHIVAITWRDNKIVNVLTIIHDLPPQKEQQGTVSRLLKTGKSIEFPCPDALAACNRYMGGVDKNDPLQSTTKLE